MKKMVIVITLLFIISVCFQIFAADYKYVGAKKCKMCHISAKSGAQYKKWEAMDHAKAYETLKSDEAKKIATEKGIAKAEESPECLRCHSTAYEPATKKKRADVKPTLKVEEGVSCESCHGPGSVYKKKPIMKDHKKYLANGGIIPTKEVCIQCHNADSPTFKEFKFEEKKAKIDHSIPKK